MYSVLKLKKEKKRSLSFSLAKGIKLKSFSPNDISEEENNLYDLNLYESKFKQSYEKEITNRIRR